MPPPYRVLLLDTKSRNPNHYICLAVRDAFLASGVEVIYAQYDNAIRKATQYHCNVFLAFDGEEIQLDICRKLASICETNVLWLTDDPYEAPRHVEAAELFDVVYTNDLASVGRYGEKGKHLPFAGCPKYHYRDLLTPSSDRYRYDLLFIGAAWPNRVDFLNALLPALPGRRFKIALSPVLEHPKSFVLPESSYLWRCSVSDFARLANYSHITLPLHRDFTTNPKGFPVASTPPPRLFEAALAGTMQLYDTVIAETAEYFEPGCEVISYTSPSDCAEKIEYYLAHPEESHAIAAAAQRRALKEHTYNNRIQTILDDLNHFKAKPLPLRPRRPKQLKRPRILLVTHNIKPAGHFGGVELYQEGLARALSAQYDVFFYYRDRRKGANTFVLTNATYEPLEELHFNNECIAPALSVGVKESAFATLLGTYQIDLVHFHHLIDHPASLVLIAKLLNLPIVMTIHDFWTVCDSHNLLDFRYRYCDIPNQPDTACDICINARLKMPPGTQEIRRAFFRRVLAAADVVIGNTAGTHRILGRFYPEISSSGRACVLPVPLPSIESAGERVHTPWTRDSKTPLQVAILGNFTLEKGGECIVSVLDRLRQKPIHFTVLGRIDDRIDYPYDKLLPSMGLPNVTLYGAYDASELPVLLRDMDVSLHYSIWPETYGITLSEAWHHGLIPIVSDIGALGERVTNGENGWKVPPDNPAALLDLFYRILDDPEMLEIPRQHIAAAANLSLTESAHIEKLTGIYSELLDRYKTTVRRDPWSQDRSQLTLFEAGIVVNPSTLANVFHLHREATAIADRIVSPENPYVSATPDAVDSPAEEPVVI